MRRYLVVGNLTLSGAPLWSEIHDRLAAGPCSFHVLVPATHPTLASGTWTEPQVVEEAHERLDRALARLRDLGADATGEVGDIRAIDATLDALAGHDYDEVIVSTLPPTVSKWLKLDLVSRLRRVIATPVTHVIGDPEPVSHH